jgi:Superinfection immunity protein
MMRQFGLRAGTWMLAGALTAMLTAACAATSHGGTPSTGPGDEIATMRLRGDAPALDRGVLTYSMLTSLPVQQTASFDVEVTDVGKGPERSAFARESHGWFVAPQDVPAGGFVSVQSICSGLTCVPRFSSTRQPVTGPGRTATWRWDVSARSPGEARILLIVTSYGRRAKIVRRETSVLVRVAVQSSPLYVLKKYLDAHQEVVLLLVCGVLAAAGALGAALALLRKVGRGDARATSPGVDISQANTEPIGTTPDRPMPIALPAARSVLGRKALLWLLPIDAAAGGLAILIVSSSTSASPGLAAIAGAVVVVTLPLYFLPVIIAYLRPAPDRASVVIVSILLGWTYVGWVIALALAVRDRRPAIMVLTQPGIAHPRTVANPVPVPREEPDASRAGQGPCHNRG